MVAGRRGQRLDQDQFAGFDRRRRRRCAFTFGAGGAARACELAGRTGACRVVRSVGGRPLFRGRRWRPGTDRGARCADSGPATGGGRHVRTRGRGQPQVSVHSCRPNRRYVAIVRGQVTGDPWRGSCRLSGPGGHGAPRWPATIFPLRGAARGCGCDRGKRDRPGFTVAGQSCPCALFRSDAAGLGPAGGGRQRVDGMGQTVSLG